MVAFRTVGADSEVLVVSNLGGEPVELPADARVLLASDALDERGRVPTDVTVWAYTG